MTEPLRVGYVLKRFPRISETFILHEILELERQGLHEAARLERERLVEAFPPPMLP